MANCNGTTPSPVNNNCFSSNSGSVSKVNCGCTPCDTPVIINQGDVSTQVLVPVLADVIQNCMCINKYETAYPTNLVFQTNLLEKDKPTGKICITGINYSYDCIGTEDECIHGYVDSKSLALKATQTACSCGFHKKNLYNQFAGNTKTNSCCCNQVDQSYAMTKIVEKNVSFSVCNLNITITGTIGPTPFSANLIGTFNPHHNPHVSIETDLTTENSQSQQSQGPVMPPHGPMIKPLCNPTALEDLGFSNKMNFAGRLCLPTNTKLNINEEFDSCILIDCIRPVNTNYTPLHEGGPGHVMSVEQDELGRPPMWPRDCYATFIATGDLSLVINKQIYATTTEKLAVMTNSGAQVVCTDGASTPACPPTTPCTNAVPCPQPVPRRSQS